MIVAQALSASCVTTMEDAELFYGTLTSKS